MTASSVDDRSSLIDIGARFDYAARVNDTVALRRCALYRRAFRGTAVAYPADVLRLGAVAKWMRREGVTVDVTSADELDRATAAGIPASRVVMHCNDANPDPIRCALDAGAARFVVGAPGQIAILAEGTRREQVVVDVASPEASALTSEVLAHDRLDLIGLHRRLDDGDDAAHVVQTLIVQMSRLSNTTASSSAVSASPASTTIAVATFARFDMLPRPSTTLSRTPVHIAGIRGRHSPCRQRTPRCSRLSNALRPPSAGLAWACLYHHAWPP